MRDTYNLPLRSGRTVMFKRMRYHYLNPDLNRMIDVEYPTIIALYKRDGNKFKLINVDVIEKPKEYFNTQPISDELRETLLVLLLNETLPSPSDKALEYLETLQHEIIEALPSFLYEG